MREVSHICGITVKCSRKQRKIARNLATVVALVDPRITASRVRAALAYTNINLSDSDEKVGIKTGTMARITSPTSPRGAKPDELQLIADACPEVPAWFFDYGFLPPAETGEEDVRRRIAELESVLSLLLEVPGAPEIPGELGRRLRAARPTPQGHEQPDSTPDTDVQPGSNGS